MGLDTRARVGAATSPTAFFAQTRTLDNEVMPRECASGARDRCADRTRVDIVHLMRRATLDTGRPSIQHREHIKYARYR